MNELKGKFVNIVLSIDEARGFESVKSPFYITANFNGRLMESDVMDPQSNNNVIFNTEMVWETEKKLLRKARGSYMRIRVECYTTGRRFIGFALLCLRSARIILSSRPNLQIPYTWTKLLNVPTEFKKTTPELNVSLTIRDFITSKVMPSLSTPKLQIESPMTIPVKYTKKGCIQVGADLEKLQYYHLKITALVASNLDLLMSERMVFSDQPKKYNLCFSVFGMDVKSRYLTRDLHENIAFNETVVINLMSNFQLLGLYFQHFPKIPIRFFNDSVLLGWTEISMEKLPWDVEDAVFHNWCEGKIEMEQECVFESDLSLENQQNRRPTITIRCRIEDQEAGSGDFALPSPSVKYSSTIDGEILQNSQKRFEQISKLKKIEELSESSKVSLIQPSNASSEAIKCQDIYDCFQQYCLDIILDAIIWKSKFNDPKFVLVFEHPKTSSQLKVNLEMSTELSKRILLENAICKLMFVTTKNRLEHLLKNYTPKLQLFQNGIPITDQILVNLSKINTAKLESSFILNLRKGNQSIADLNACVFVEEVALTNESSSVFDLMPHILDDSIILQSLKELEEWKSEQRKTFQETLRRVRKEELAKLNAEWNGRKNKLENALRNNIERCQKLSRELKKNANNLKLNGMLSDRKEQDDQYNIYIEIHKNTVRYALSDPQELIEKISELEVNSAVLRDLYNEQHLELQEIKKNALTEDQTKMLLQDLKAMEVKYEEVLCDKNYFKSEYEKAVKEVHMLKQEDYKNITNKIADNKEALSQLNLTDF